MRDGWIRRLSPIGATRFGLAAVMSLLLTTAMTGCQSDDEKIAAFYEQGQTYAKAEQYQEAVIEFKNVLKINPNHANAHYELAKAYLSLGRARDAYWEMSETARLDPANTEAVLSYGAMSLIAKEAELALSMAEQAIEAEPENHQGYLLQGKALQALKRDEDAEASYLKAVELTEDLTNISTLAAYYAGLEDGREKAEPWYWKLVEKFPDDYRAYSMLALFLTVDPAREAESEQMFKSAIANGSEDEDQMQEGYANLARFYFDRGRPEVGEATLREGAEKLPESTVLRFMLATYYQFQGDFEQAEATLRSTIEIDPQDPNPYLVLSHYLGGQQKLEAALEVAEQAVAVAPESQDAQLRRAELLVDIGFRAASAASQEGKGTLADLSEQNEKIRDGLQIVENLLAETPFQPQAEFVRGKAYLARGDSQKGIEAFRAAAEGRPDWAQAQYALGSAQATIGEHSLARVQVARALELDPSMHQARRVLATIHQALGEHEYAIEQGNLFLQVSPGDNEIRVLVAQSLIKLGRREAALKELNKVPSDQRDAAVEFAIGRTLASIGDPDTARSHLLKVLETSPHNQKVLRSLFRLDRGNEKNYAQTRDLIAAAVEARPDDSDLIQLAGMVQFTDGDLEAAEKSFIRATEVSPDDIEAHQQLARFYSLTGRTDETIATYERAVQVQPESASLHHFLALLYEAQGDVDKAERAYENAIKYDDNHAFAKNNLAYLLADTGKDLDRALDLAQDAKALLPNDANAADTLGWVLYKRGVTGAAVGYLKESVENADADDPALGVMRHHLALAYEADGSADKAAAVLRTAIDDLEAQQRAQRAAGRNPVSPPWESDVRNMLERLSAG